MAAHPAETTSDSQAEPIAAEDAKLKAKADARRALEDLIFDITDEMANVSARKVAAAEDAEAWLSDYFDGLSTEQINKKYRELRAME